MRVMSGDNNTGAPRPIPGDEQTTASLQDLAARVHFEFTRAEIWWDEERMLLMHSSSLGSLRKQLIEMLGWDRARGVLTRMGFVSGKRDAEILRQRFPDLSDLELLRRGTMMRTIQGIVKVELVKLELDIARSHYFVEARMTHSIERYVQDRDFGGQNRPVCWIETGHASGFVTELLGRLVLHKEFESDDSSSRVIGKPLEEWRGEADDELSYYQADSVVEEIVTLRSQVVELQQAVSKRVTPADLIRSGPACLNSTPRFLSGLRAGCRRCRVVHGGGRRLRRTDRRGGQLGAHQRSHLMRPWPRLAGGRSSARRA
jgi:two-component system response regulator HydG